MGRDTFYDSGLAVKFGVNSKNYLPMFLFRLILINFAIVSS